ncbi:MAG: hypothetical protein QOI71_2709, partial [Gaiellales bacterium]|nr:hypothetical protein [Gaiellales bacterium]
MIALMSAASPSRRAHRRRSNREHPAVEWRPRLAYSSRSEPRCRRGWRDRSGRSSIVSASRAKAPLRDGRVGAPRRARRPSGVRPQRGCARRRTRARVADLLALDRRARVRFEPAAGASKPGNRTHDHRQLLRRPPVRKAVIPGLELGAAKLVQGAGWRRRAPLDGVRPRPVRWGGGEVGVEHHAVV